MKNVQEFVKKLVNIEYIEESKNYGHYPFSMFVEDKDSKIEIGALALGGDVLSCYKIFKKHVKNDAKRIYLSVDFPAGGDINNDFVCVFEFEDGLTNAFAIPYETQTGKVFDQLENSEMIKSILKQLNLVLFNPSL